MIELKYLGLGMIFAVSSGVGFSASYAVRKGISQLHELQNALELIRCEISSARTPFHELCEIVARAKPGAVGALFQSMSNQLSDGKSSYEAANRAMEQAGGLHLSAPMRCAAVDLLSSFGRYDLEGQLKLIDGMQRRIEGELAEANEQKLARCRSYEILGVCTGLAMGILVL